MTVNVLGTPYTIMLTTEQEEPRLAGVDGFMDETTKEICVDDMTLAQADNDAKKDLNAYRDKVIRHEIIHAFLNESGLAENSEWARNEEMVDWVAKQFPKIMEAFQEAKVI